ncbi:MAG: hypothetical protein IBX55_07825 [Methyloprofundus sp.]|nr:hypothetical protein [Methyloprofundus sp.]MBW6454114.1 hypothetical protein [Methyloprofundus sp.]
MPTVHDMTQLIGNTPLVKLNRLAIPSSAEVFLKIEANNPRAYASLA